MMMKKKKKKRRVQTESICRLLPNEHGNHKRSPRLQFAEDARLSSPVHQPTITSSWYSLLTIALPWRHCHYHHQRLHDRWMFPLAHLLAG